MCVSEQDPLCTTLKGFKWGSWFFYRKRLWQHRMMSFCFCDVHFWCQVWRTLLQSMISRDIVDSVFCCCSLHVCRLLFLKCSWNYFTLYHLIDYPCYYSNSSKVSVEYLDILFPKGCTPFGQHQESQLLGRSSTEVRDSRTSHVHVQSQV